LNKAEIPKTDYAQIAKHFDRVRPLPTDISLVSKVIEYGKIDADCIVLDVGCGTGRFPTNMPAISNLTLCALEPSTEMLKQATVKDKSKRILWVRGDGQRLPFQDTVFDCVYMTSVIHHIGNKEVALREIYRALKVGGRCVIMSYSHTRLKKHIIHYFPGVAAIDSKRVPSVPMLKKMMTNAAFKDVTYHAVQHNGGYIPTEAYLERVKNKYISTLTLLSKEEFQTGLRIFEKRIRRKCGDKMRYISWFVFIVGEK